MPNLRYILGIVFLLFTGIGNRATFGQDQPNALLLGIRYEEPIPAPLPFYVTSGDSISRFVYRTYLIVRRAGEPATLSAQTRGLMVPRRTGLWEVDAKRSVYNSWVEDFLASAPYGRPARLPGIQAYNGEYCEGHRVHVIHFAGPSYLGIEQRTAGYCEDAAHPWYASTLAVVPVDSTTHTGVPITEVLGRGGREALASAARQFRTGLRTGEERDRYYSELDEANWTIVRRSGNWQLRGRMDSEELADTRTADFNLALRPPASLVGHDELFPEWNRIREFAPDARDALSSPSRDMLVLVRPRRLTVHPIRNGVIGAPSLEVPLPPGASVVMAQWTAMNADAWARTLRSPRSSGTAGWQSQAR